MTTLSLLLLVCFVSCVYSISTVNEDLGHKISRVFMQQALQEDSMWPPYEQADTQSIHT